MSAGSAVLGIANFKSETVVVNGVRRRYWIGGNPKGIPESACRDRMRDGLGMHSEPGATIDRNGGVCVPIWMVDLTYAP